MGKVEKIIFGIALACVAIHGVIEGTHLRFEGASYSFLLMHGGFVTLIGYYLITTKPSIYSGVLVLFALLNISQVMGDMHLAGAREVYIAGLVGEVLFGVLLIIFWNQDRTIQGGTYLLVVGAALIAQAGLVSISGFLGGAYVEYASKAQYLSYVFVGGIGTIKLSEFGYNDGIDRTLNIPLLMGLFFVISSTLGLMG